MEQMGKGQPDRRYISASHPAESLHLQVDLCANFKRYKTSHLHTKELPSVQQLIENK